MLKSFSILVLLSFSLCLENEPVKLNGTAFCSNKDDSANLQNAFSSDLSKEFKSKSKSYGWVALDLETPHIITKIGFAQKSSNSTSYMLGLFEGSNEKDFSDSYPLYMIKKEVKPKTMTYINLNMTSSFKYVRYVGPNSQYSVISGLEFYGVEAADEAEKEEEIIYQPTEIPLVIINSEQEELPADKIKDINCLVKVIDGGKINIKGKGTFKLRGNNTSQHPKKPYKIKFEEKVQPLDLPANSNRWNLIANFYDKSLLRTAVAMKISEKFEMEYTPGYRIVDLIINGEYKGNYYIIDQVEIAKGRLDLDVIDENVKEEPEITGGYFLEVNSYTGRDEEIFSQTLKGIPYNYKNPSGEEITEKQMYYIDYFFSYVEDEVYNGIIDHIDQESFIKFLTVNEITATTGAMWSDYLYKKREDDKLYFGPVWDYDNSLGNDYRTEPNEKLTNFNFKYFHSAGTMRNFVIQILNNKDLLKKFKNNWKKVSESSLKEDLINFIDEKYEKIKDSANLNFIRWDILKRTVGFNPSARCTYEGEIKYLKDWILKKFDLLDVIFENATLSTINKEVKERSSRKEDRGNYGSMGRIDESCFNLDNTNKKEEDNKTDDKKTKENKTDDNKKDENKKDD